MNRFLKNIVKIVQSRTSMYLAAAIPAAFMLVWIFYKLGWKISLLLLSMLLLVSILAWFIFKYQQKAKTQDALRRFSQELNQRVHLLKQLKTPDFFKKKKALFSLPHYLLIGAEGSGKSRFLQQSGIHFPALNNRDLNHSSVYSGLGCDWWCADHAVVIDIAGQCLDDDNNNGRWSVILKQLKSFNRQYSLDGILIMIHLEQILHGGWQQEAKRLRAKIDSLYQSTGYRLPVHIVFSHCDKLPGFSSFFSRLTEEERGKSLGIEFSHDNFNEQAMDEKFHALCRQFQLQLFQQLPLQEDVHQQLEKVLFVEQFIESWRQILPFILCFHKESRYQEQVFLRSVHFTSSKDERAQGYFSRDFLKEQLKKNKNNVLLTHRYQQHCRWIMQAKRLVAAMAFTIFLAALCYSFIHHWRLLKKGEILLKVEQQSAVKTKEQKAAFLQAAAKHYGQLDHEANASWYYRLGMNYSGYPQFVFKQLLLNILEKDIKQQAYQQLADDLLEDHQLWLKSNQQQREAMRGLYYSDLKTALMLQYPHYLQPEFALYPLLGKWKNALSRHGKQKLSTSIMTTLLAFYLQQLKQQGTVKPLPFKTAIFSQARHDLAGQQVIQNKYAGLAYQMKNEYPNQAFEQLLDDNPLQPLSIEMFYSRDFYQQRLRAIFNEYASQDSRQDWVLKRSFHSLTHAEPATEERPASKEIQQQNLRTLQRLYFQDRLMAWISFIERVRFLEYHSLDDAIMQLQALEQKAGVYRQFLSRLHQEFSLKDFVEQSSIQSLPAILKEQWQELANLTLAADENHLFHDYLKQLSLLRQELERLSLSNDPARQSKIYAQKLLGANSKQVVFEQVVNQLDGMVFQIKYPAVRKAFHSLLLQPVKESYRAILTSATEAISMDWKQKIYHDFQTKLARRFPYHPQGEDITLADFMDFYRPVSGKLDSFLQQDLSVFLNRQGGHYQSVKWQGVALPFRPRFLQWLEQQEQISATIFLDPHGMPTYHFAIQPSPSPGVKEILLALGGKSYPYRNGPQEWIQFQWPGKDNQETDSLLRVTSSHGDGQVVKQYQGSWGLFHLLKTAKLIHHSPQGDYQLSWQLGRQIIKIRLKNQGSMDLFDRLLFHPMPVPERLFSVE